MTRTLVTGATGYIGGRLVPRLLESGYTVRCMARNPRKLQERSWSDHPRVEIVRADASRPEELRAALRGCGVAYYLIHSMLSAGGSYSSEDRRLATSFATCAEQEGVDAG